MTANSSKKTRIILVGDRNSLLKKSNAGVGDSNMQFKNRTVETFERNIPVETGKTDDSIRTHPYGGRM
jgi:hypothetical protein